MAIVLEIVDLAVCPKIHGWTFLIIDGNMKCGLLSVSTPPPPITHRPINCKNYGEWGDSVALEIGWLLFMK
jgi:hypothetical protein